MTISDFFQSPNYSKYKKYQDSPKINEVFAFIESPESINKMILATERGRPALEGIIKEVEKEAGPEFDIENDHFLRQAVGAYVKFVLVPFGYEVPTQKQLSKSEIITSATSYTHTGKNQTKRLVCEFRIEEVRQELTE